MESEKINTKQVVFEGEVDNFESTKLGYQWNFIRNPQEDMYSLVEREGYLRLYGSELSLNDSGSPTFVGRRQQHFNCKVETLLDFFLS